MGTDWCPHLYDACCDSSVWYLAWRRPHENLFYSKFLLILQEQERNMSFHHTTTKKRRKILIFLQSLTPRRWNNQEQGFSTSQALPRTGCHVDRQTWAHILAFGSWEGKGWSKQGSQEQRNHQAAPRPHNLPVGGIMSPEKLSDSHLFQRRTGSETRGHKLSEMAANYRQAKQEESLFQARLSY